MTQHRLTTRADWFRVLEVAPGIFHIDEPLYRADYRCNIFLVKGKTRDIVIDSGLGLASLRDFLRPLSANPTLVCSHSHYDHMGSNWEFEERLIQPSEAEIVAHPTRQNTLADPILKTEDFLELPYENFDAADWIPRAAPTTGFLNDGDTLDLGDRQFEILHTPGHSWGSICLYDARSQIIFCADTVYEGEIFDFLPCSDIPTYVQSMNRVLDLPIRVAFPGHGAILMGAEFRAIAADYVRQHEAKATREAPPI